MESRIHGDVYVRFGEGFRETYHSNMIRRSIPTLQPKQSIVSPERRGLEESRCIS